MVKAFTHQSDIFHLCLWFVNFSSQVVHLLAKEGVPIHFFNYYGFYDGSFYPRETLLSGNLLIKQAEHYMDHDKRMVLAKKFVEGASKNMEKVVAYYKIDNQISHTLKDLDYSQTITDAMNVEARIRSHYYTLMDEILPNGFKMEGRSENLQRTWSMH